MLLCPLKPPHITMFPFLHTPFHIVPSKNFVKIAFQKRFESDSGTLSSLLLISPPWTGTGIEILGDLHRQFACSTPRKVFESLPTTVLRMRAATLPGEKGGEGLRPSDVKLPHVARPSADDIFESETVYINAPILFRRFNNNNLNSAYFLCNKFLYSRMSQYGN